MAGPLVSFVTWNRLGLTDRNLKALLKTTDDFELHLADNNSRDGTWEYLQRLEDPRIKSKTRFSDNKGQVYAVNYHLSKRKPGQFFITVDSDVNIHNSDWICKFVEVFRQFPETGLLGAVSSEYMNRYRQLLIRRECGSACYLQTVNSFVEGCCQCIRPELLDRLGYWSEECCTGDMEMCHRIRKFTKYTAGFIPAVEIDQLQYISCESCGAAEFCKLRQKGESCFQIHRKYYKNPEFRNRFQWKYQKLLKELEDGKKSAYCASIHDPKSMQLVYYDRKSSEENFKYFVDHANGG